MSTTGTRSITVSEDELIALLNSAPLVSGEIVERLDDVTLRAVRGDLQRVIRGDATAAILDPYLADVVQTPRVSVDGIEWELTGPASALHSARYVVAWSEIVRQLPGRLRACENHECTKFLVDHSKPNTARWCSMAECGNRMKARRHHARAAERATA